MDGWSLVCVTRYEASAFPMRKQWRGRLARMIETKTQRVVPPAASSVTRWKDHVDRFDVPVLDARERGLAERFAAALGGLDTIIFSGGIGEHAPLVRARMCEGLDFLGIRLDQAGNEAGVDIISTLDSQVTVRVMRTDEEIQIAQSVCRLLAFPSNSVTKGLVAATDADSARRTMEFERGTP